MLGARSLLMAAMRLLHPRLTWSGRHTGRRNEALSSVVRYRRQPNFDGNDDAGFLCLTVSLAPDNLRHASPNRQLSRFRQQPGGDCLQCPGDCSPCLGPSDPFCNGGSGNAPGDSNTVCWLCRDVTASDGTKGGQCVKTNAGQQGFESCSQTSVGTFPAKCVASGNSCTVNP